MMPGDTDRSKPPPDAAAASKPGRARVRRLGIALLFAVILLIPRLLRWRRRPAEWLAVRLAAGAAGLALILWFTLGGGGAGSLTGGVALAAFAALVRARPETKGADDVARELEALVVVNGGSLPEATGAARAVNIFVNPERLVVLTRAFERVAEIPLAGVFDVSAVPVGTNGRKNLEAWELRIGWDSGSRQVICFRYQGVFAEHLARVAGQTITSVWKRTLPVLPS